MTVNIEKIRADMKWETRKFVLQAVVAGAALLGAGAAIGTYLARREQPPAPAPQVYIVTPDLQRAIPLQPRPKQP